MAAFAFRYCLRPAGFMGQTESVCISPQIPPEAAQSQQAQILHGEGQRALGYSLHACRDFQGCTQDIFQRCQIPGQQSENACHQREKKDISSDFSDIYNTVKDTGIYKFKFSGTLDAFFIWDEIPGRSCGAESGRAGPTEGALRRECTG